jgi:hypothetical protein
VLLGLLEADPRLIAGRAGNALVAILLATSVLRGTQELQEDGSVNEAA